MSRHRSSNCYSGVWQALGIVKSSIDESIERGCNHEYLGGSREVSLGWTKEM